MKYSALERDILMRALDNYGVLMTGDTDDWPDEIAHLMELGVVEYPLYDTYLLTESGKKAARALINLAKKHIGEPGYCKFCGAPEQAHGHYEDGSEDWECPRCGFCEDHHLDKPAQASEPFPMICPECHHEMISLLLDMSFQCLNCWKTIRVETQIDGVEGTNGCQCDPGVGSIRYGRTVPKNRRYGRHISYSPDVCFELTVGGAILARGIE